MADERRPDVGEQVERVHPGGLEQPDDVALRARRGLPLVDEPGAAPAPLAAEQEVAHLIHKAGRRRRPVVVVMRRRTVVVRGIVEASVHRTIATAAAAKEEDVEVMSENSFKLTHPDTYGPSEKCPHGSK